MTLSTYLYIYRMTLSTYLYILNDTKYIPLYIYRMTLSTYLYILNITDNAPFLDSLDKSVSCSVIRYC